MKGYDTMPATQPKLTTLEQYEALPEDTRAEVYDGQIYYMAGLSQEHQTISTELTTILNTYVKNSNSVPDSLFFIYSKQGE